ncbi:hypothetical protein BH09BAC2_BH09BAC2_14230 [soil metagenome]
MNFKILSLAVLLPLTFTDVNAQTGKVSRVRKVTSFKPPVVTTKLDDAGTKGNISAVQAGKLIGDSLIVTDAKKNRYMVTSYQFLYKRKSTAEDQETGARKIVFTTLSDIFKTTPLPAMWVDKIKREIKSDEELHFFDIIVQDANNRRFFAPELKFKIQ